MAELCIPNGNPDWWEDACLRYLHLFAKFPLAVISKSSDLLLLLLRPISEMPQHTLGVSKMLRSFLGKYFGLKRYTQCVCVYRWSPCVIFSWCWCLCWWWGWAGGEEKNCRKSVWDRLLCFISCWEIMSEVGRVLVKVICGDGFWESGWGFVRLW